MDVPALIDPPLLAQRIGVGVGCLAKWRLTGQGPPFIRVGRRIHYDPRDVTAWLDSRRASSTTSAC
jgi:hypothetical protein